MLVTEKCVECLMEKQLDRAKRAGDESRTEEYLEGVRSIIANRREDDSAPYLVYLFNGHFKKIFGNTPSYAEVKKEYNDLVLGIEKDVEDKVYAGGASYKEALFRAAVYARIGNYIDFGAMTHVDKNEFLAMFDNVSVSENDRKMFEQFYSECSRAENFLLVVDNSGEVVLDKIFLRVFKKCFPSISIKVLVRGAEVLNDVTREEAEYVGLDKEACVIDSGSSVAGTIYEMLSPDAKEAFDKADVILAKGQGNFETMSGKGHHVYYSFLCKCEYFTNRFDVPMYTGMFAVE